MRATVHSASKRAIERALTSSIAAVEGIFSGVLKVREPKVVVLAAWDDVVTYTGLPFLTAQQARQMVTVLQDLIDDCEAVLGEDYAEAPEPENTREGVVG
jgi:hypothetical protein